MRTYQMRNMEQGMKTTRKKCIWKGKAYWNDYQWRVMQGGTEVVIQSRHMDRSKWTAEQIDYGPFFAADWTKYAEENDVHDVYNNDPRHALFFLEEHSQF